MDDSDKRAGRAFLGGAGTSLVSTVATQAFPGAPVWLWQVLFAIGVILMGYGAVSSAIHHFRLRRRPVPRHPNLAGGKYIVGARAEDEPGTSIGPLPAREALKALEDLTGPEFIPLDEAGQWLYDNGEQWLRDTLKDPRPFKSITEHAAALVGSAADEGIGELRACREPGLKPEKIKYSELKGSAYHNAFGDTRPRPVDPVFRRADLPSLLTYYKNPAVTHEPIKVRRDTRLREGLMYFATGKWGQDPMADGANQMKELLSALDEFRQHAADGSVTVWGKRDNHGVWTPIDPSYWINHRVDFLDVLREKTGTRAYNQRSDEPLYLDLMVCRAEFEHVYRLA